MSGEDTYKGGKKSPPPSCGILKGGRNLPHPSVKVWRGEEIPPQGEFPPRVPSWPRKRGAYCAKLLVAYFFWEQLAVPHVLPMCTGHDVWQNAIVDKLLDYLALALCQASRQYAVGNAYNANWARLLVVCNSAITTLTNRASVFSWAWHSEHLPKVINLSSIRVNHRHDGHNFKSKLWNCTKKENCPTTMRGMSNQLRVTSGCCLPLMSWRLSASFQTSAKPIWGLPCPLLWNIFALLFQQWKKVDW